VIADVVPAQAEHIAPIVAKAREADKRELWALARATPLQCLRYGFKHSRAAFTGRIDGEPVCMFGATAYNELGGIGVPWMVTSTGLDPLGAQKALLRLSRPGVAELRRQYPVLVNVVHGDNAAAIRWLRWCGFTIHPAQPMGPDSELFHPFTLES
jgi:hypothetical protein